MFRNSVVRRKLIIISMAMLLLAAVTVVLIPKKARADEGAPFRGTFTVAFWVMPKYSRRLFLWKCAHGRYGGSTRERSLVAR